MAVTLQFRRGRVRRCIFWTLEIVGWTAAAGMALVALGALLEPVEIGIRVMNGALALGAAIGGAAPALALQRWSRDFAANWMEIGDAGVRGHFRDRDLELAWTDIRGVEQPQRGLWVMATAQGPVAFSAIDIPSPRRAAKVIAARLREAQQPQGRPEAQ